MGSQSSSSRVRVLDAGASMPKKCLIQPKCDAGSSGAIDLTGTPVAAKNSGERAGFAIFNHPENRLHPVPWYAATKNELYFTEAWTNFANAAFLWNDPMEVGKGEELAVRHRVVVHDGTWTTDRLTGEWSAWTAG